MQGNRPISFFGLFIFDNSGELVFSHHFKLVEERAKSRNLKIPNNQAIKDFFKNEALPGLSSNSLQLTFELSEKVELVVLSVKNFYLSVIPLIEAENHENRPSIEVSAAFSFLSFFEVISRPILKTLSGNSPPAAFAPIRQIVIQAMPFGTPALHDAYFASMVVTNGDLRRFSGGYQTVANSAVPSWKISLLFPRPQLDLKVNESILGSIDGKNNTFDVYGELRCVASIPYLPDIKAIINNFDKIQNLASHFCLKSIENNQIVFSPPTGLCQLLQWRAKVEMNNPPVDGVYAIREDENGLNFSLTINIRSPIKEVTVQFPFPGRGSFVKPQFQSPGGQLKMSRKEATFMWVLKDEESVSQTLTGTLNFDVKTRPNNVRYCAYVNFNSKKKSFSGVSIDKESISFSSSSNVNITTDASYSTESKRYIFWETPLES